MDTCKICCVLFFSALLCTSSSMVDAQELPSSFKTYAVKDGLSSNTIHAIRKDRFGFLWLATEDGLSRFDGINFKVYRHDPQRAEGLKVNHITALQESSEGNLWIGTNGGSLSFYDRLKDSVFSYDAGEKPLAPAITSIATDRQGMLWVGSYGGVSIIDPKSKKIAVDKRYQLIADAFKDKNSLIIFKDRKNHMWIGTDEGLYEYDEHLARNDVFKYNVKDSTGLCGNYIMSITEDSRGRLWIGTMNGLSMRIPGTNRFRNFKRSSSRTTLSSDYVYALESDGKNALWIGTDEGLDIMDITTFTRSSLKPNQRNPNSISSRSIRSIFIDRTGIYWVGTYQGGLNKYDKNLTQFTLREHNAFDPYGLRSPIVTSFAAYGRGVFIGTDGGGLHWFNRESDQLEHIKIASPNKGCDHDLAILAMEMGADRQLWVGTYTEGLFGYDPETKRVRQIKKGDGDKSLNHNDIFCLKRDRKGNVWIGTNGGGVNVLRYGTEKIDKFIHNPKMEGETDKPSSNYIRSIEEDNKGNIWIGTFGGGISVFHPESQKFTFYTKENSGLPSDYVLSLKADQSGNIWVGTSGNGVALLKSGSEQFTCFSESDGLINGVVQRILEDQMGNLWFSTNKGLSCYAVAHKQFKNYTHHAGLQPGPYSLNAGICLPDGEVFFGGQKGFNYFNPKNLKINRNVPPVVLTDLKIDNQLILPLTKGIIASSLQLAKEIHLKYKQNFSISFEALNFTAPEENQYEYRLEGFDADWIRAGKEHVAYYTNLDPGNYVFRARASNNDGVWNEEGASIHIIVAPPFWRTPYAYAFYLLLAGSVLFFIRYRGIKKLKAKFALEQDHLRSKQRLEQERKDAEYLHQMDRMKIKFLTNLSHEFRTPISLIMGPVDHLLARANDAGTESQLYMVKRNARRLLNLVNQLLDFRKMEEKELKLQCGQNDLVSFIEEVSDSFNDMASRKKIDYAFYSNFDALPAYFDQDKIERILFNLLSNAFKFTAEGGTISLRLEEVERNEELVVVQISVKDTGIGIPMAAQKHIFDSFFQYDTGEKMLNQGTGIGLSIARTFVAMHGGELQVMSETGKGSIFTFDLKLKRGKQLTVPAAKSSKRLEQAPAIMQTELAVQAAEPSPQATVLIVEDDDDFRFYMKDNLKRSYKVFEAANGKEAWQRALFHHPDVIVCDVQMPVMNGLDLVRKLKADKRTKHIPVILLTASNEENGLLRGLASGATDYMIKPFDFAVLQAKISNLLLLNQAFKDAYSKQLSIAVPNPELVSEKEKFLKKVVTYVQNNLNSSQLSVETLSSFLLISRASLYNRLLEYTGMTPVEFIRTAKLERASYLLENGDKTIAEVAYETGFANPNYFTKVFKAKYELTPTEFIQTIMKERS